MFKKSHKLFITILLALFLMPLNVFAYSNYIIAGGENIGISINSTGIIVIGKYKIDGEHINKNMVARLIKMNSVLWKKDFFLLTFQNLRAIIFFRITLENLSP